jgi:hypothetical protein
MEGRDKVDRKEHGMRAQGEGFVPLGSVALSPILCQAQDDPQRNKGDQEYLDAQRSNWLSMSQADTP